MSDLIEVTPGQRIAARYLVDDAAKHGKPIQPQMLAVAKARRVGSRLFAERIPGAELYDEDDWAPPSS